MIDYTLILTTKYPNSLWTLDGDDYDGLTWVSDTPKPSKATLDGLWNEVQDLITAETEAKAAAKAAAQAKLEALGLTVEDLQALGL
jgi:hypothetical protein